MQNGLSTSLKAGNSFAEGITVLAILLVIIVIMPKGAPNPTVSPLQSSTENPSGESISATKSPYEHHVFLGTGNAAYSYQPHEEYVTIDNSGRDPVNITSWQLKNGKDRRAYDFGSALRYFPADIATIGQAALFISPWGLNMFQDVVLKTGETAIITTGQTGPQLPHKIVSFKENICSGYLEDLPEYAFTPSLARQCPRPADEPGVGAFDTKCRRFIERMAFCHTPEFDTRDREGDICYGCVDNEPLSGACVAFIKNHFNYAGCITNHRNDADFSGRTWRVFLGRSWEMWAQEYEVIELFDQLGRLVDQHTYWHERPALHIL